MRDVGGWTLRLTDEQITRYTTAGIWGDRSLADNALDLLRRAPEQMVAWDQGPITVHRVVNTARAIAGGLRRAGVGAGDVIAFQLPNRWECLAINLAACLIGAVVTPIVPIYREKELRHMLGHSGARAWFVPDKFRGTDYQELAASVLPAAPALRQVVVLGDTDRPAPFVGFETFISGDPLPLKARHRNDANAVKLLLYTSGTTGRPKGVLHTHNTLAAEMTAVREYWQIQAADVALTPSPVTHITGFLYGLEMPFALGSSAILMDVWDGAVAVELALLHRVTVCIGATPFLSELVAAAERQNQPLPDMRLFACGGAPVPASLVQRAQHWLPNALTMRVYGSTEAPTICLGIRPDDDRRYAGETEGRIVGHEAHIVDVETGLALQSGDEGEVVTSGPELFVGYADPADNEPAFLEDGAFLTGDLGRMVDRDFLQLTGRKKELIIRGGVNIAPKEIEDVLLDHADIQDVAVVAIPHRRLGETVGACIVTRPGTQVTVASLAGFLAAQGLARQKWPQYVECMAALPRTPSGKVQKVGLKNELAGRLEPL